MTVLALAENIVLCSWARHLTLTVPLSTQVNVMTWGNPSMDDGLMAGYKCNYMWWVVCPWGVKSLWHIVTMLHYQGGYIMLSLSVFI